MVALLWAMNAGNSGYTGAGDSEQTSAMALVEQYGTAHIVSLRLSQPGRWHCELEIDRSKQTLMPTSSGHPCRGENRVLPPNYTDGSLTVMQPGGAQSTDPLRVIWRWDKPPGDDFLVSLAITVENLSENNLIAEVGIEPCCDRKRPHYVHAIAYSGAGKDDWFAFWHEADALRNILKHPPYGDGWITRFRSDVQNGSVSPRPILFDANGKHCKTLQGSLNAPVLKIVFEAEGDVRFIMPPRPSTGTNHQLLAEHIDDLLSKYVGGGP